MSGRKKKLRMQVIDAMLSKQISVPEAQARMGWVKTGVYQPPHAGRPRAVAVKSAGPDTRYERYLASTDPQIRQWAEAAAHQDLVTKGLVPWEAPAGQQAGRVRAAVWAPGPDGRPGWQVPQAAGSHGVRIAPDGVAGR